MAETHLTHVVRVAEADGNRTRLTEILGHYGFEDRGEHQLPERLPAPHPGDLGPGAAGATSIACLGWAA